MNVYLLNISSNLNAEKIELIRKEKKAAQIRKKKAVQIR